MAKPDRRRHATDDRRDHDAVPEQPRLSRSPTDLPAMTEMQRGFLAMVDELSARVRRGEIDAFEVSMTVEISVKRRR